MTAAVMDRTTNTGATETVHGPVLKVENVAVAYNVRGGEILAVQNVSFEIKRGESYGIVGESGCGKSTMAWAIVNFLGGNGYVKQGSIKFMGQELVGKSGEELRQLRGDQIAMVYQDPMQALNPSLRLGSQMKEVLTVHRGMSDEDAEKRCIEMLDRVHMPDAADVMTRYPHQISGGQQRETIGQVFQSTHRAQWITNLDVDENIYLAEQMTGRISQPDLIAAADKLAKAFGLEEIPDLRESKVSRDRLMRAQWVRAFLPKPLRLLILECPTFGVPTDAVRLLLKQIQRVREKGTAVIWIGPPLSDSDRDRLDLTHHFQPTPTALIPTTG